MSEVFWRVWSNLYRCGAVQIAYLADYKYNIYTTATGATTGQACESTCADDSVCGGVDVYTAWQDIDAAVEYIVLDPLDITVYEISTVNYNIHLQNTVYIYT